MDYTGIKQDPSTGLYSFRIKKIFTDGSKYDSTKKGFKTKSDASRARVNLLAELEEQHSKPTFKRIRFGNLYLEFIDWSKSKSRRYSTIIRYDSLYNNHIKQEFEDLWLDQIDTKKIDSFINSLYKKKLSYSYIESFYKVFQAIYKYADKFDFIKGFDNPMEKLDKPAMTNEEKKEFEESNKIITKEEFELLKDKLKNSNNLTALYLGYYCGLRVSETYAIRWSDINFEESTIEINKQLQYQDYLWCLSPPKTYAGYRKVIMPTIIIDKLKEIQYNQNVMKHKYKKAYKDNSIQIRLKRYQDETVIITDFVNTNEKGELITPNSAKYISKVAKEIGINDFSFHTLRHTFASTMADYSINPELLRTILGHEKITTTLELYTHITEKAKEHFKDVLKEVY